MRYAVRTLPALMHCVRSELPALLSGLRIFGRVIDVHDDAAIFDAKEVLITLALYADQN